jgi:hypothetical protein
MDPPTNQYLSFWSHTGYNEYKDYSPATGPDTQAITAHNQDKIAFAPVELQMSSQRCMTGKKIKLDSGYYIKGFMYSAISPPPQ